MVCKKGGRWMPAQRHAARSGLAENHGAIPMTPILDFLRLGEQES
jgi:hypothetical protein